MGSMKIKILGGDEEEAILQEIKQEIEFNFFTLRDYEECKENFPEPITWEIKVTVVKLDSELLENK